MSRPPNRHDVRLIDRFLDGALQGDELVQCRRRCESEPELRVLLQQRQKLRAGFAAGRGLAFTPPAGFASRVLVESRRLPVAGDGEVAALCRRILLVAAAVVAAALLWQSGWFGLRHGGVLEAAPDEMRQAIDDLDARIRAEAGGGPR